MPKIPSLPSLTTTDPLDLIPIEDTSSGTTKRVSVGTLLPFEITGVYNMFYVQPNQTGTAGVSYDFAHALPRTVASGEGVTLIPIVQRWSTAEFRSNNTTDFAFTLDCTVTTTSMRSTWSAIYYKAH